MSKGTKPDEAKKPGLWSRLKTWQKLLIILIGIFILFGIIGSSGDTKDSLDKATNELENYVNDNDVANKEETVEKWQDVTTVSGSTDKKTEPFNITGKRWKVIYTITPDNDYAVYSMYAYKPGSSSGDNIVMFAKESGETIMYSTGELYLDISSANCSWAVKVQQLVDVAK